MSKLKPRLAEIVLTIILAVSGCTFSDDLTGQIGRDSSSIKTAAEELLLLNIVRAGHAEPMAFSQVSSVLASGSISGTLGLPFALFGPGAAPAAVTRNGFGVAGTNSVDTQNANDFTLSVLDTKEFWLGMLTPLSFDTLNFFISRGVPRDLLFSLYILREESTVGTTVKTVVNDPADPSFPEFLAQLRQTLRLGLTTDSVVRTTNIGPPLSSEAASDMKNLVELHKAGLALRPVSTKDGSRYQIVDGKVTAVLCFEPGIATTKIEDIIPPQYTCPVVTASDAAEKTENTSSLSGQTPFGFHSKESATHAATSHKFYLRSTYDIMRYLGSVAQADIDNPHYVDLVTREAIAMGKDPLASRLFVVEKNSDSTDDFISVMYRGDRYSIPMKATTTLRVMSLVRQLIALSTSINSLPATGGVVISR
ncbi:hypothetical protein [Telmatospirillum sp.]|uniref:hypothetical protein n=1 Tax=Telmatospirillum sp. TaxID=2079197 RepID=UPI00284626FE|nr:hypothetical protein [Telmatospirillum sp.]MDR3436269.1 hypothetical protein [Telmatospirillum sp.]